MKSLVILSLSIATAIGGETITPLKSGDLQSVVGKQVHLEGNYGGPGKLADFVVTPDGQVYLFDPIITKGEKLAYGNKILVEGELGYRSYPPVTQAEAKGSDQAIAARPLDHFYINKPKVSVIPVLPIIAVITGANEFRSTNNEKIPKATSDEVLGVLNRFAGTFKPSARDCRVPEQGPMAALEPIHALIFITPTNENASVALFVFSEKYSVLQISIDSKVKQFFSSTDQELIGQFSKVMQKEPQP